MDVPGFVATLLVRFALANKGTVPYGWAPRILVQCNVPYVEVWDVFHEMYESQVILSSLDIIPFNKLTGYGRFHPSMIKPMCRPYPLISQFFLQTGWRKPRDRNHTPRDEGNFLWVGLILRLINT
jgi:hypothetical protein